MGEKTGESTPRMFGHAHCTTPLNDLPGCGNEPFRASLKGSRGGLLMGVIPSFSATSKIRTSGALVKLPCQLGEAMNIGGPSGNVHTGCQTFTVRTRCAFMQPPTPLTPSRRVARPTCELVIRFGSFPYRIHEHCRGFSGHICEFVPSHSDASVTRDISLRGSGIFAAFAAADDASGFRRNMLQPNAEVASEVAGLVLPEQHVTYSSTDPVWLKMKQMRCGLGNRLEACGTYE